MVAKVNTLLTNKFVPYPEDDLNTQSINSIFERIEESINAIVAKITSRGYTMNEIELKRIGNITQVVSVMNENIDLINKYFSELNMAFEENYLLQKEVLETMSIDIRNKDTAASVSVFDDYIRVSMANGQVVKIMEDFVSSVKGQDSQEITHG